MERRVTIPLRIGTKKYGKTNLENKKNWKIIDVCASYQPISTANTALVGWMGFAGLPVTATDKDFQNFLFSALILHSI